MIEKTGDLWKQEWADALVITTNGAVRKDGAAVMGRGCALEAKTKFPDFPFDFGKRLNSNLGNRVYAFDADELNGFASRPMYGIGELFPESSWDEFQWLVTFPVKHHWRDLADLDLIEMSTRQLRCVAGAMAWDRIIMPRPGCGNGNRNWESEVKSILDKYLDDRFEVYTYG